MTQEQIGHSINGAALKVHSPVGPGLLERMSRIGATESSGSSMVSDPLQTLRNLCALCVKAFSVDPPLQVCVEEMVEAMR